MCNCTDTKINDKSNEVILEAPLHIRQWSTKTAFGLKSSICVDRCLEEEIKHLWSVGITTTGCCCGHNQMEGYIGVINTDIQRMKDLGYKVQFNPCRPGDEDSFYSKSVEYQKI